MKTLIIIILLSIFAAAYALAVYLPTPAQPTPNQVLILEGKVKDLEKRVNRIERIIGIQGGLKEGLQHREK